MFRFLGPTVFGFKAFRILGLGFQIWGFRVSGLVLVGFRVYGYWPNDGEPVGK